MQFALSIPINREHKVQREPNVNRDVDLDTLTRLIAIANQEGLHGQKICGVHAGISNDGKTLVFNFEYDDPFVGFQ